MWILRNNTNEFLLTKEIQASLNVVSNRCFSFFHLFCSNILIYWVWAFVFFLKLQFRNDQNNKKIKEKKLEKRISQITFSTESWNNSYDSVCDCVRDYLNSLSPLYFSYESFFPFARSIERTVSKLATVSFVCPFFLIVAL